MMRLIMVLFVLLEIFGCSKPEDHSDQQQVKTSDCTNGFMVLTNDSLPFLDWDYNPVDSMLQQRAEELTDMEDQGFNYFLIPVPVSYPSLGVDDTLLRIPARTRAIDLHGACWVTCKSGLDILINSTGQILFEYREIGKTDSLAGWMADAYLKKSFDSLDYQFGEWIEIKWDTELDKDRLKNLISKVAEGHLFAMDRMANVTFDKGLCDLDSNQLNRLKMQFPLVLDIDIYDPPILPLILEMEDEVVVE